MPTTTAEVSDIIRNMKRSSSAGTVNICSSVLKAKVDEIASPLAYLINSGIVPSMAKTATVVPVFKAGDKNNMNNYRPISILSSLSKIYKRILYNRLLHTKKFHILDSAQYGFRRNRTTCM